MKTPARIPLTLVLLASAAASAAVVEIKPKAEGKTPAARIVAAVDGLEAQRKVADPKAFLALQATGDAETDAFLKRICDAQRMFWAPDGVPAICRTTDYIAGPTVPRTNGPGVTPARLRKIAQKGDGHFSCVWVGDSITHYWESTQNKFFPEYDILNLGIAGECTQHVLWRLRYGGELDGYTTDLFMVLIGTNNYGDPPEQVAAGVKAILDEIRAKHPMTPILLMANFPRDDKPREKSRAQTNGVNSRIRAFANGTDILWLDMTDKITDSTGSLPLELFADRLHPTQKGYAVWAENIRPYFAKYCKKASGAKGRVVKPWPQAKVSVENGVTYFSPADAEEGVPAGYAVAGVLDAVSPVRNEGKPCAFRPNPKYPLANTCLRPYFAEMPHPLIPEPRPYEWWVPGLRQTAQRIAAVGTNSFECVFIGPHSFSDLKDIAARANVAWPPKRFLDFGGWSDGIANIHWLCLSGHLDGYRADKIVIAFGGLRNDKTIDAQREARRRIVALVKERHPESEVIVLYPENKK